MKKYRGSALILTLVILPSLFLLMSCSSSSGGGDDPNVPSLSNLDCPSIVYRGETYVFSFDYSDPDGNIETGYYRETWSGGSTQDSYTTAELGITGTSGTVTLLISIDDDDDVGTYHIEIWVEDTDGHTSNRLEADIEVR